MLKISLLAYRSFAVSLLAVCSMLLFAFAAQTQTIPPPYINYQAILYDVNGPNPNAPYALQSFPAFVNLNDELGNLLYREEHYSSTDANGQVTIKIGDGLYLAGPITNFNQINWASGKYYLVVEFDINGTISATAPEQLVTVPYAFYAGNSGSGISTISDNGDGTLTFTYNNGGTYTTPVLSGLTGPQGPTGPAGQPGSPGPQGPAGLNGQGGVSIAGNNVLISGSSTSLDPYVINSTDSQSLSVSTSGDTLFLENGGFAIVAGISSANLSNINYPIGSVFCGGVQTAIQDVFNPVTGKIWMDRSLGAKQRATSSFSSIAYGDLYQWGRAADGHQCRDSYTTGSISSSNQPGHSYFVLTSASPHDWRSPQNSNLWQGVNGVNNPCPLGYRIPSSAELDAERLSWSSQNAVGAFNSPIKWSLGGFRTFNNGDFGSIHENTFYWSSTNVPGSYSKSNSLFISLTGSNISAGDRATGCQVRCIKN
jgi:uncharacterized protein (TIGR02145 family)